MTTNADEYYQMLRLPNYFKRLAVLTERKAIDLRFMRRALGALTVEYWNLTAYEPHELGLVLTNERGAPIQQHPFSSVETARTLARLPEWATPHDLRHYFASLLIKSGASGRSFSRGSATQAQGNARHLCPRIP
jgi:site-specific recombinase XerD